MSLPLNVVTVSFKDVRNRMVANYNRWINYPITASKWVAFSVIDCKVGVACLETTKFLAGNACPYSYYKLQQTKARHMASFWLSSKSSLTEILNDLLIHICGIIQSILQFWLSLELKHKKIQFHQYHCIHHQQKEHFQIHKQCIFVNSAINRGY